MAEEQTPMKQEKFDESHESHAQSLTPRDDSKDYEIHLFEIQLEKLKRTLSDDSSPFHDLPNFTPSTLTFPGQFYEIIQQIENDGWETAIKRGLTQQIIGEDQENSRRGGSRSSKRSNEFKADFIVQSFRFFKTC